MRHNRLLAVLGVTVLLLVQGNVRASSLIPLMYCTPWFGCYVAYFYYEHVEVVASAGRLDLALNGRWGVRDENCPECELENPPPAPEPADAPPDGPNCGDERDNIILEYGAHGVNLTPTCFDFEEHPGTRFVRPGDSHGTWGIVRGVVYHKLALIQEYSGMLGDARVSSGYRCPHQNRSAGGATQSRHVHGDALDLYPPPSYPQQDFATYTSLRNAALQTEPSFITDWNTYGDRHLHVDWR